jgi:hypothetical protein
MAVHNHLSGTADMAAQLICVLSPSAGVWPTQPVFCKHLQAGILLAVCKYCVLTMALIKPCTCA